MTRVINYVFAYGNEMSLLFTRREREVVIGRNKIVKRTCINGNLTVVTYDFLHCEIGISVILRTRYKSHVYLDICKHWSN